jgi:zinc transport system ATP-binding protein
MRKKCFYELSGGQRQRVLIARALCSTDKVLLLDEPVNGLDPKIVTGIYEMLYDLNKNQGLTIIMVSHDIDRSIQYSTRVIEIENGKIVKDVNATDYKREGV